MLRAPQSARATTTWCRRAAEMDRLLGYEYADGAGA